MGSKISVKKIKSLSLGISEDVKVTSGNDKLTKWKASLTLVVLLVNTVGTMKMLKEELPRLHSWKKFSQVKNIARTKR